MSTNKKAKRPTKKERRIEKKNEIVMKQEELEEKLEQVKQKKVKADLLISVANGLYEELDKLSKKAPVDEATDLVVDHVNSVINDVRVLSPSDPYIQRVKPFVPAGNNPEHRDVVLILKQVLQGLDRSVVNLNQIEPVLQERIALAQGLIISLDFYIEKNETQISQADLKLNDVSLPKDWWIGQGYGDKIVNLSQIDDFDTDLLLPEDK